MKYDSSDITYIHSLDSRKAVGYALEKLHDENEQIVAVYADVGSRFSIKGRLEKDEIEIGIAEQTLIPMLGGIAHEGRVPFGIAYAPFITMRAADQIRMTVGEMGLNIKLVGGSAGLISGNLGAASLGLDDISMIRAIPNIVIMSPSDSLSEVKLIELASQIDRPVYVRLTGGNNQKIYVNNINIEVGMNPEVFKAGDDAVIYATGAETARAINAGQILKEKGIYITVVDLLFIKPLNEECLLKYKDIKNVFTVEEHNVIGGMGGMVAEFIAECTDQRVTRLGVKDTYMYPDTYDNLVKSAGLDSESIALILEKHLKRM